MTSHIRVDYDIESLGTLFTIVFLHDYAMTALVFGDSEYDHISDHDMKESMKKLMSQKGMLTTFDNASGADDLDYNIIRMSTSDDDATDTLSMTLNSIMMGRPLPTDRSYGFGTVTYCGWNSHDYDLPLMVMTRLCIESAVRTSNNAEHPYAITPRDIRHLSDVIIEFDGAPWRFAQHMEDKLSQQFPITAKSITNTLNLVYSQGCHVDWARAAKLIDGGQETRYPPGLKKEMARFGLDIVIDDLVLGEGSRHISDDEFVNLLYYNANDVLGTRTIGMNDVLQSKLATRDTMSELYNYVDPSYNRDAIMDTAMNTTGRHTSRRHRHTVVERDTTDANLAASVLIGPHRIRPQDSERVNYLFPLPDSDAESGYSRKDLLDYIVDHEQFVPDQLYAFFDHFRGRDTRERREEYQTIHSQPITHKATMNCPYYRDGKPVDAYIRVSTGGAHGSVMAGLSEKSLEEVDQWIRSDVGALDSEKPTVDCTQVNHLDWSSFYPTMASKLELYKTDEGIDRYTEIIKRRIEIKKSLPFDKSTWTDEHKHLDQMQQAFKLVLNSATGAGNTHNPYALLPLDNKTISMRLIGNMLIWCLAQRLTQAGGYIVSTNTDGVYMIGLSPEETQHVVDDYVKDYGMGVDPEIVDRFINRDTSNRIEIVGGNVQEVRGRLRHGESMHYTDWAIGKNIPYPLVVARAVVRYMTEDDQWMTTAYNRDRMRTIMHELFESSTTPEAWYQVNAGSAATRLTIDGVRQPKINRVVMTTPEHGHKLGSQRRMTLKKDHIMSAWNMLCEGESLRSVASELNIVLTEATVEFADDHDVTYVLCHKAPHPVTKKRVDTPIAPQPDGTFNDGDDFTDYWKAHGPCTLHMIPTTIYKVANTSHDEAVLDALRPVHLWNPGSLTGYTSEYGLTVNTTEELSQFDMSTLDIDAYMRWAEELLSTWKVTADIPEIGYVSRDDTVVEKVKKRPVSKKKQKARDMITWLYESNDWDRAVA